MLFEWKTSIFAVCILMNACGESDLLDSSAGQRVKLALGPKNRGNIMIADQPSTNTMEIIWLEGDSVPLKGTIRVPRGRPLALSLNEAALKDPSFIKEFSALPVLYLEFDKIAFESVSESLFKEISLLSSMQELNFAGTTVDNEAWEHLAYFADLKRFHAPYNFSEKYLFYLSQLETLQELDFSGTELKGADFRHLEKLNYLKSMRFYDANVGDEEIETLEQIVVHLEDISLAGTSISDQSVPILAKGTHLRELGLSRTNISDEGLSHLNSLSSLEMLDINYTNVTNAGINHLRNLPNLKYLYISNTRADGGCLESLLAMPKLEVVHIEGIPLTYDEYNKLMDSRVQVVGWQP